MSPTSGAARLPVAVGEVVAEPDEDRDEVVVDAAAPSIPMDEPESAVVVVADARADVVALPLPAMVLTVPLQVTPGASTDSEADPSLKLAVEDSSRRWFLSLFASLVWIGMGTWMLRLEGRLVSTWVRPPVAVLAAAVEAAVTDAPYRDPLQQ